MSEMHPSLITAAVTPFTAGEKSIDEAALKRLFVHLVNTGSEGILVHGTTGEGPCLTLEEKKYLIAFTRTFADEQLSPLHIMAGVGGNNTLETCEHVRDLLDQDAKPDSILISSPHYSKPTQAGMVAHFIAVADVAEDIPIVLYNIPGRTGGQGIDPATMKAVYDARPQQFIGVKQSIACMDTVSKIIQLLPPESTQFRVWSGDDSLTLPMMSLGAVGAISVSSHLVGDAMSQMIAAHHAGHVIQARLHHQKAFPVMNGLFTVTNPLLVKSAMAQLLDFSPQCRLPMLVEAKHQVMASSILSLSCDTVSIM